MLYMYLEEDKYLKCMTSLAGCLTKYEVYTTYSRQTERIWEQQNQRDKRKGIHLACCFRVASNEVLVFVHLSFMYPAMSLLPSFQTWATLGLAAETSVSLQESNVCMGVCTV